MVETLKVSLESFVIDNLIDGRRYKKYKKVPKPAPKFYLNDFKTTLDLPMVEDKMKIEDITSDQQQKSNQRDEFDWLFDEIPDQVFSLDVLKKLELPEKVEPPEK
ncbi:hypothetical protein BGX27_000127, partial [Mortierella sp. AM989]